MQMLFSFMGGFIFAAIVFYPFICTYMSQVEKYSEYIMHSKNAGAYYGTKKQKEPTASEVAEQKAKKEKNEAYINMAMSGVVDDDTMRVLGVKEDVNS